MQDLHVQNRSFQRRHFKGAKRRRAGNYGIKEKHLRKPAVSCVSVPSASYVSVAAASSNEPALLFFWNPGWTRTLQPLMPAVFCGTPRVKDVWLPVNLAQRCTECIGHELVKRSPEQADLAQKCRDLKLSDMPIQPYSDMKQELEPACRATI